MPVQVGGGGDQVSFISPPDSSMLSPTQETSQYTPAQNTTQQNAQYSTAADYSPTSYTPYANTAASYSPAAITSGYANASPYGAGYGGNPYGGTSAAPPAPPPPVHHDANWWRSNGALTDSTYVAQKAALLDKLNSYEQNVATQIGDQNLQGKTDDAHNLLGSYFTGKALGKLFNPNTGHDGDVTYDSTGALGGSLGSNFNTALANFNNQQSQGYRNLAEDFAARGMLGGQQHLNNGSNANGSGVWENQRADLNNQYTQQLNNLNTSATQQYNDLLSGLAQQYSGGQTTLGGYLTDAANRLAAADAAGLPTT